MQIRSIRGNLFGAWQAAAASSVLLIFWWYARCSPYPSEVQVGRWPIWRPGTPQTGAKPHLDEAASYSNTDYIDLKKTSSEIPKVALLFLAKDRIANEAVWLAFLQAAAQLQLQPTNVAAAAAAAVATSRASITDAIGTQNTLHPDLGSWPEASYPGYKVQHGKMGSAWRRPSDRKVKPLYRSEQTPPAFPGAALEWESAFLNKAMATFLTPYSAGEEPGAPRLGRPTAQLQTPGRNLAQQQNTQKQQPQMQVDAARCLAKAFPATSGDAAAGQFLQLFSVYVHTPIGMLLPRSSMLSGCELLTRVNTSAAFAQHTLVEAEILLLQAAVNDPLNAKFVLLSDTSIPLYPPQVMWAQLMSEPLSRVTACITTGAKRFTKRYNEAMETTHFSLKHWRKSGQWFTLSRPHALLAVADKHVSEVFRRHCYWFGRNRPKRLGSNCVSDEHWLPSLLASYGLDNQTDCMGQSHYTDWSSGGWHPRAFETPEDLTPQLVRMMRLGIKAPFPSEQAATWSTAGAPATRVPDEGSTTGKAAAAVGGAAAVAAATANCDYTSALQTASNMIFLPRQLHNEPASGSATSQGAGPGTPDTQQAQQRGHSSQWLIQAGYMPLGPKCRLFARKFPDLPGMENATLSMVLSCAGVGVGSWCRWH